MYIDDTFETTLKTVCETAINEAIAVHEPHETHNNGPRVITLNDGRTCKACIAPKTDKNLTIDEILNFIYLQAPVARYTDEYNHGFREAIELLHMFVDARRKEDSQKNDGIDANCC